MKPGYLIGGAFALTLGFCAPGFADLITISLGMSNEDGIFSGSKNRKDQIKFEFGGGDSTFPSLTGKATSVKQVTGKADQNDTGDYLLRYLGGVNLTLTHGKDQDKNTWNVEQTGPARFIQFCYAKNTTGECTRLPNPPALLDSTFNLITFKQNPDDKDGKAVFNFNLSSNLLFFNNPDKGAQKNVGGKLLDKSPQFQPPGTLTLTLNLGKGFDLNSIAGADKEKKAKVASGEAKIKGAKPAEPDKKDQMMPAKSKGKSAFYDAAAGKLSIRDDRISDTGFTGDPILDADVNLPDLFLAGAFDDIFVFIVGDDAAFDISHGSSSFVNADLPVLFYDAPNNSFFGELTDFSFASLGSPWAAGMSDLFDPGSAGFDPRRKLWFTYAPDENLHALTQGFSVDGFSSGTNGIFAAPAAVAVPSGLALVAIGLLGVGVVRLRGRRARLPAIAAGWGMRGTLIRRYKYLLIVAAFVAGVFSPARAAERLESSLREAVHTVPVAAAGASIVVTSFRPRGDGPFPWIVLSHGSATTAAANRALDRYRPLEPVREWVRRGYAVLVPVRRGYGASGGDKFGDSYGTCDRPDFRRAGEGAALDLLVTVEWAKLQQDLDAKRWLLVGQSAGGFASIYTASKRPQGLVAVLAFAPGRAGDPDKRRGEPCVSDRLAELFAAVAPKIAVPVLWFYAENDEYIGPRVQKLWFESFRSAGGRGELVVAPYFPDARGHGVFPSRRGVLIWTGAVAGFFKSQRLDLPF
jgi:dienelactone hydrolase